MGFGFIDPLYFIFVGPCLLLSMWASFKVKSSFKKGPLIEIAVASPEPRWHACFWIEKGCIM